MPNKEFSREPGPRLFETNPIVDSLNCDHRQGAYCEYMPDAPVLCFESSCPRRQDAPPKAFEFELAQWGDDTIRLQHIDNINGEDIGIIISGPAPLLVTYDEDGDEVHHVILSLAEYLTKLANGEEVRR